MKPYSLDHIIDQHWVAVRNGNRIDIGPWQSTEHYTGLTTVLFQTTGNGDVAAKQAALVAAIPALLRIVKAVADQNETARGTLEAIFGPTAKGVTV